MGVAKIGMSVLVGAIVMAGCSGPSSSTSGGAGASPGGATSTAAAQGRAADATDRNPITFADPVFERLLKAELGKDEIAPADLVGYTRVNIAADQFLLLSGNGRSPGSIVHFGEDAFEYDGQRYTGFGTMTTLADLAYFPDLTNLLVTLQPGIDYSTIPVLDRLTLLNIMQSQLTDIGFASAGTKLNNVSLDTNAITDLGPLASCTSLTRLDINYNQVGDLTPLAGLTKLTSLRAYGNQISDISALARLTALKRIGFYGNQISDITVLASLPNLTEVELINNRVEDVSPLAGFTSFERLALTGNPVRNLEVLGHIENLEF
ncbi:leucine-rich repeat domain-containing protein [Cellulomonas sp. P24]|uniref:leucine-rich repeat domain-containing protein n=1 Tax=Cellulomonas sp. P24 TaxID=2885206 RepID=UPI00216B0094|nr:leucine-rich repeat domain-containing protein [Cellulomonas sp. P24]MCR6492475.1 hypothetical protein [Cellulomonas sp. P24]